MKEMWNIADRGGKHHDPVNGPPTIRVYRREEAARRVRGEESYAEARTQENFQGRERPRFVRPLSRHKPASFLRHSGGRSRP